MSISFRLCLISPERGVSSNVGVEVLMFVFLSSLTVGVGVARFVNVVDWSVDADVEVDGGFEPEPEFWRML
ncbi:hypothetical protein DL95DRAFT_381160 [Leptodontidium sp. 2 PMI_412]|nr:hypothetical protein DL95DRAFT_381160 [Leptodontidium sp. 2 PMI_412]